MSSGLWFFSSRLSTIKSILRQLLIHNGCITLVAGYTLEGDKTALIQLMNFSLKGLVHHLATLVLVNTEQVANLFPRIGADDFQNELSFFFKLFLVLCCEIR